MFRRLFEASRPAKRMISLAYDALAITIGIYLSICLRLGTFDIVVTRKELAALAITIFASLFIFIRLGMYRAILRYMTQPAIITIVICVFLSGAVLAISGFMTYSKIPRSVPFIYIALMIFLIGGPRLLVRQIILMLGALPSKEAIPVIVYGAGRTGHQLLQALQDTGYRVVAFVDDNKFLHGTLLANIKIYSPKSIPKLMSSTGANKLLLALGRASHSLRLDIIKKLERYHINVQTIPEFSDIVSGKARIENLRDIDIDDLLGRDSVQPMSHLMDGSVFDKVVLVTGAGGSIGGELCRQLIELKPKKLILFDHNEFSLYSIERELAAKNIDQVELLAVLGSVQNACLLASLMNSHVVQTVYHAAAYKHVPLVENNCVEGMKNNVFGTLYCAEAAIKTGVELLVLISTDKAVRPTNIMGASKRLAELILQSLAEKQMSTRFVMVRFGNVLGSSGSVVPVFRQQIKDGGPVTVTHPDIIRYFMTIREAAQLVIQAGTMGKGGDVFVLDMGEPVKIVDLARRMIHLSGLSVRDENNRNGDINISYTGLRPGEKLFEELLIGDNVSPTEHSRVFRAMEQYISWREMESFLAELSAACEKNDIIWIKSLLLKVPVGYLVDSLEPCPIKSLSAV
ncbi:nucleoside-diphosphate sugar epimerase/dehydratase [Cellvibrio sp. UBA7661]|uniref:polysaccharide biosynthesis protein n=1 Tax=Cellvibrio sp. UBA7661 TaxID=1946311 RepID=UPI002F35B835